MNKISIDAKGFNFFDYELDIMREKLGFEFKKLKKNGNYRDVFHGKVISYKVLEDPVPVEATKERLSFLENELPYMLNAIKVENKLKEVKNKIKVKV